jgi:hypothetical protein
MFNDLNSFIAALDKARELARIDDPVDPILEISALTDRVSKTPGGGPGLFFERPTGFDTPVAVNLFGSMARMCMALGVAHLDELAEEIEELATPKMPSGLLDTLKMLPMVNRLRDLMPKTVADAPCQAVVRRNGTLDDIPILKCWPEDGGRYITSLSSSPGIRRPASATSAPTACRCTTAAPPACTGSGTRVGRSITASPSVRASGCPSPSRSGQTPRSHTPRPRRCPKGWTS